MNISIVRNGSGTKTGRLIIPTNWLKEMQIDENNRKVKVSFDGNRIIVEKEN